MGMETGTQTEHLLTIPLEVLAVSCITYNMIDKIRDVLQQAERDLWILLFGNSIPESVLGQPSSCTSNPPPTNSPPPTSPSSQPAPLREEANPPPPPTSHSDTLLSYLPSSSANNPPIPSTPGLYDLSDIRNLNRATEPSDPVKSSRLFSNEHSDPVKSSKLFSNEHRDPVKSSKLFSNEPIDLDILTPRGLADSKVGQMPTSASLKRKPDVVTSRESGRNGKSGKRVKHQNGKKDNCSDLHAVKIKEEPLVTTEPSPPTPPSPNNQFRCEQCRAEFVCQERLSRHVTMVHSSRPVETVSQPAAPNIHQCVICNQTFSNSTVLREHQLKHHRHSAVLGAGLICNICGKCSTDKTSFEEHKKKHTINKSFRCHVCYKGFSQNDNLLQHLRVIHNVKERKCVN